MRPLPSHNRRSVMRRPGRPLVLEALEDRTLLHGAIEPPADHDSHTILVRFQPQAAKLDASAILPGASTQRTFLLVPGLRVIHLGEGVAIETALHAFRSNPNVMYAEPNGRVQALLTPNDPSYSSLYGMNKISAPAAWDIATGSKNVLVAVIDTGIDYTHPDLADNIWVNSGEIPNNGVDDDGNGYIDDVHGYDFVGWEFGGSDGDPYDDHYHGTHVAGTIGAIGNNNEGVAGVNWNASMAAVKFLDSGGGGSWEAAVAAIEYAVKIGAKISNNSWGGSEFSIALYDAVKAAGQQGHLFIAASGNDGSDADSFPLYPAGFSIDRSIGGVVYAGLDNIVSVAATDSADNKAGFSNWGLTSAHLGAPGVDILSTMPGNGYGYLSGTSMATPHVAGVAALAWGLAGDSTYTQIKNAILSSVDPITALRTNGPTPVATGGRLNAFKTLQAVGMAVSGSNPTAGSIIAATPTDFVVHFSHPYDPTTVQAGDLTVNGIAATTRTLTDADTVTFHFAGTPITVQGVQTMHIAAGALAAAAGTGLPDLAIHEWNATFRYDAVPMQVLSTAPAAGSAVTLPLALLDVHLNEPVAPSSVQTTDLVLSQGAVTAVAVSDDRKTISFTLSGITSESTLTARIAAGALTDAFGNPNQAFSGNYTLDIGTIPFPTPLAPVAPLGSLVFRSGFGGVIAPASDTDSFTIDVDAGQTISVLVMPSAGLRPTITLNDPLAGSVTAAIVGQDAVLQTVGVTPAGTYTVTVGGADGTSGSYTVEIILNAALELESHDGPNNNSPATAQNIDGSFVPLLKSATRGAVLGRTGASDSTVTVFSTDFEGGASGFSVSGLWHLSIGHGPEAGHSPTQSMYFGSGEKYNKRGAFTKGSYEVKAKGKVQAVSGALTSPPIALPTGGGLTLDFNYILQTQGSTADQAKLQISADDGKTWSASISYNGVAESRFWRAANPVDLSAYSGKTVRLRFNFTADNAQNNFEGWYVDDIRIRQTLPHDNYSFTVAGGQKATVVLEALAPGDINVLLRNADGTSTIATGAAGPTNVDKVIYNFPLGAGTYNLAITGQGDVPYALVVTYGAVFDLESNNSLAAAQPLDGTDVALGYLEFQTSLAWVAEHQETVLLTALGNTHPVTAGLTNAGLSNWSNSQHSYFTDTADLGVLATNPSDQGNILAGNVGAGRVVYFGLDPSWHQPVGETQQLIRNAVSWTGGAAPNVLWVGPHSLAWNTIGANVTQITIDSFATHRLAGFDVIYVDASATEFGGASILHGRAPEIAEFVVAGGGLVTDDGGYFGAPDFGWVPTAPGSDVYSFDAEELATMYLFTATPGDGSGAPGNTLNPRLRLFNPAGVEVAVGTTIEGDGRNEEIWYTVPIGGAGTYRVEVTAESGTGPYVLDPVAPVTNPVRLASPDAERLASAAAPVRSAPTSLTILGPDAVAPIRAVGMIDVAGPRLVTITGVGIPGTGIASVSSSSNGVAAHAPAAAPPAATLPAGSVLDEHVVERRHDRMGEFAEPDAPADAKQDEQSADVPVALLPEAYAACFVADAAETAPLKSRGSTAGQATSSLAAAAALGMLWAAASKREAAFERDRRLLTASPQRCQRTE
jgi:subtilisin family serine protease